MNRIECGTFDRPGYNEIGNTMYMLAKFTQNGHTIKDLDSFYNWFVDIQETCTTIRPPSIQKAMANIAQLPHGTIKRFTPITLVVVGASRRFLAQARTHQVGMTFVSASLQYGDHSTKEPFNGTNYDDIHERFCVPYEMLGYDDKRNYLDACACAWAMYNNYAKNFGKDAAGYIMPQGLRNVLIIQGNHQSWEYFIRTRLCNRNTQETQYVAALLLKKLLEIHPDNAMMLSGALPDCLTIGCREGRMSCKKPPIINDFTAEGIQDFIEERWPKLYAKET